MSTWAVIVAAGLGSRMKSNMPKVLIDLNSKPALWWTIKAFNKSDEIDGICLVSSDEIADVSRTWNFHKLKISINGGEYRGESVLKGLLALPQDTLYVAIHDGARACVTEDVIKDTIFSAKEFDSGISGIPVTDTLHKADADSFIVNTPSRANMWTVQTPQSFSYKLIKDAYKYAELMDFVATDDASIIINYGKDVKLVRGDRDNIKLTLKSDIEIASRIIKCRVKTKIGIGYDTHLLVEGRKLILGGVNIPFEKGLLGHSDGDVLIHAIMDALLGAAGMVDIGQLFPDNDEQYRGSNSIDLLQNVLEKIKNKGLYVNNIDAVVICQQPKIVPFRKDIIITLSKNLNIPKMNINIKATTTEGVNAEGRGEAISAQAIVSLMLL